MLQYQIWVGGRFLSRRLLLSSDCRQDHTRTWSGASHQPNQSCKKYNCKSIVINTLILTASKDNLAILMKSFRQKHCKKNIWRRNINQNSTNSSHSNVLQNNSLFQSYCQKYLISRRQFLEELLSIKRVKRVTCYPSPPSYYGSDQLIDFVSYSTSQFCICHNIVDKGLILPSFAWKRNNSNQISKHVTFLYSMKYVLK